MAPTSTNTSSGNADLKRGPALAAGRSKARPGAWLALILVAGIAPRLLFASGFVDFDDRLYVERAYRIIAGLDDVRVTHQQARIGMVVPTAALFALCGVGVTTSVAMPFACSIAAIVVAFVAGRRLFDERTGLIAAALLALFPLDVIFAANLSPTAPIGLFGGASILLFAAAERARSPALAAAAGVVLGVAFCFAETPLLVLVAYAFWAITIGRPSPRHGVALLGFAVVLLAEMAVSALLTGDPLARYVALLGAKTVRGTNPDIAEAGWNLAWLAHPLLRVASEQELGLYLLLGLPLAAWRLVVSEAPTERTLALFAIVLFAWISYGTVSPFGYAPLDRLPRYYSLFQIPLILLLALWLRRLRPRWAIVVAVLIAATSLVCVALDGSRSRSHGYARLDAVIERDSPARVAVEGALLMPLLLYQHYQPRMPLAVVSSEGAGLRLVEVEGIASSRRQAKLEVPGTYLAVRSPELRRALAGRADLELVERVGPADSAYRRLLSDDGFRKLLALTRSQYRMTALDDIGASDQETIEVYAVR